ncbi:MAG: type II toxin-antitoxin system VapC family toxin [Candidatus Acidiferrales bacterium]
MIFLDTNILLYALGAPHALKSVCADLLRRVGAGSVQAITNTEVVQEILHVYSRRGERKKGLAVARDTVALFSDLLSVTRNDAILACDLMRRYPTVGARDAIHAATMFSNGIQRIVSLDPDYDVIREIERIAPQHA